MSWLLFMDESGHDHKNTPLEVRGGIALHAGKVWTFIQDWHKAQDDAFGVQAADLCLYCINWGFRRNEWNFTGPKRDDIHTEFSGRIGRLQFSGDAYKDGNVHKSHGIVYVPDPYTARTRDVDAHDEC